MTRPQLKIEDRRLSRELSSGDPVRFSAGINPRTQEKIKIPAKTVVKFRVAKALKDAILGGKK